MFTLKHFDNFFGRTSGENFFYCIFVLNQFFNSMKQILAICLLLALVSCNPDNNSSTVSTERDSVTAMANTLKPADNDPDPADSIPGNDYPAYNSDVSIAKKIAAVLADSIVKADLNSIPAEQRKFKYHAFDLNNDSADEYLVAAVGPYFCGSGGCTSYLLDQDFRVINTFSVMDFPVYVAASTSEGWQDLILQSGSKFHYMKRKNGKYPSNPSVVEVYKGDPPSQAPALLDIFNGKYPAFSF